MIDGTQTHPFSLNDFQIFRRQVCGTVSGDEQRSYIPKRTVTGEPLPLMTEVVSIFRTRGFHLNNETGCYMAIAFLRRCPISPYRPHSQRSQTLLQTHRGNPHSAHEVT